jgi:hypothetical protein
MGNVAKAEKGNTNMALATQKAANEKYKYGNGCSTMFAISNETGVTLELSDVYSLGQF